METNSEDKIVETFTETLRIVNKNTIPRISFISKHNEWSKQFETGFKTLAKTKNNLKLSISPNRYLRFSVTSLITICFLESIRCKNTACCLTGLAFFTFLISWNLLTTVIADNSKHDRSINSIIFYVDSLADICKIMTHKLNHTRQLFKIIAGPNFLYTIPGCYKSPVRFKFYNFLHSWLHFCLSWLDVFGILFAVQISIALYVFELPDFLNVLQYLSGIGILLVAFLQYRKSKKSREKMQQARLYLKSITSEYFQWFENKCRLQTLMLRSGYLDLDVQEWFHYRYSIFKKILPQSHLMSAMIAVGVAYGLQYEIREDFLSDAVRYFLFNKLPKRNLITERKINVEEQNVRHTSIKKELNSCRDFFGKFTNFITSQRVISNLPAVVPKEDSFMKHDNGTSNEGEIKSSAFSNSNKLDGKTLTIESEQETETFTLCPLPSPESLEHKKQEDLEPIKVEEELKDISQLEGKASEINPNIYNQGTSSKANVSHMATDISMQEQPENLLQQNDPNQPDSVANNPNLNVTDEDREFCHFEWNRLKTTENVVNKFKLNDMVKNRDCCSTWNKCQTSEGYASHQKNISDIPLLNGTFGNHKCCKFIWNHCQAAGRYLNPSNSFENPRIDNELRNSVCCQFIWNHCQAFESYLNKTENTEVDGKLNNIMGNDISIDNLCSTNVTKTFKNSSTSPLMFEECRAANHSKNDTPSNQNHEEREFRTTQDTGNGKVFENTDPFLQTGPVSFNKYGDYNSRSDGITNAFQSDSVCYANINMRATDNSLRESDSRGSSQPVLSSESKDNLEIIKDITSISKSLSENRSKNNQHLVQQTNKIDENNTYFPNLKERRKRTRKAEKRTHKKHSSSSADESSNEVNFKVNGCLVVKRIRKLSLGKFTKRKLKQEDSAKPQSRILQSHQQKLLKMRHGYDIHEEKEENSHYLSLSDEAYLSHFKPDSTPVASSTPANGPQSTFASDWTTNNQSKFESSQATGNQSMSLPAFVSDNQSALIPTQNSVNQPVKDSTLPSDNHFVIESSPETSNLPTKSPLMIFKARNSLDHSQFKENTQAYFKNNVSVSAKTKDSNLTATSYEEGELPCTSSSSRYSDSEALTINKKNRSQWNQLLKNFDSAIENYISTAEISDFSKYSLSQNEGKIYFQLVTDNKHQKPINFEYDNNYSSFDQGISTIQQYDFTEPSNMIDAKTDPKLDLGEIEKQIKLPVNTSHSQSDLIVIKRASASNDTVGLSEENILLTSKKYPDTTADKNWKKRRTSISEIQGTKDLTNSTEEDLQASIQSKNSTKPKKLNMRWKSDINVNGDPVSDLEEGPERDPSPPENPTEPLTYSLKCGNMNLQFTENSPHVSLRFVCESNEDITEQKVTKHSIYESEHSGDDEFVIPKHNQVNVLEGSTADNEMSFTINSANGNLISKSTNLKGLDVSPSTTIETRSRSSSFQSEPSSSESPSTESEICSESEIGSPPISEAHQSPLTTDGHIEEIPMAEAVDGDINQDLHFETDNVKLNFVPTSTSGTLQISYRQSFGHNRLIFKSNDKKLKLKTKK